MSLLEGKVAIITGSGRGIGRAAALHMVKYGASVVINDLDEGPAMETLEEIKKLGGNAVACVGNITDPAFPGKITKMAVDNFGGLHILVNNAGFQWDSPIQKMTDEQWQTIFDVNITAPFRLIRAASPYMRDEAKKEIGEGKRVMRKVVNVMSIAGTSGLPAQANYASAKAALGGLTKCMAKEWGRFNINVNAVAFGYIETRLTATWSDKPQTIMDGKISVGLQEKVQKVFVEGIPMGRSGTPEEAAYGILFMASPWSDYVTGQILIIDGGLTM